MKIYSSLEDGLHYQYSIIGMVCMDILQLVLRDNYLKQGVFHFANTFYAQYTQLYTAGPLFQLMSINRGIFHTMQTGYVQRTAKYKCTLMCGECYYHFSKG